jgi:TP901 family phage tail tape measure protein
VGVKKLEVIIAGDAKSAVAAMREVEASTGGMAGRMKSLGGVAQASFLVVGAAAVGAAVGLLHLGGEFHSAFTTIRTESGLTGAPLKALEGDFKSLLATRPENMQIVAKAIADVHQKVDLVGQPLQALTRQFLQLSSITKTDVSENIKSATELFNNFGVAGKNQGGKLDELFRIYHKTGVSVQALSADMTSAGPVLRGLGLGFDQAAALAGTLGKAGLSLSDVMPALSKTLATAAKHGEDAGKVFSSTFDKIRKAPTDTAAAGVALDVFGKKAGPKLALLIREGKLSYEDLLKTVTKGTDTIGKTANDTATFGGKWKIFLNWMRVALEPVATKVFDLATKIMSKLGPAVMSIKQKLEPVATAVKLFIGAFQGKYVEGSMHNWMSAAVLFGEKARAAFDTVMRALKPIVERVAEFFAHSPEVKFALLGAVIGGVLLTAVMAVAGAFMTLLSPVVLIVAGVAAATAGVIYAYRHFQTFHDIVNRLGEVFKTAFVAIRVIVQTVVSIISDLWDRFGNHLLEHIRGIFSSIAQQVRGLLNILSGIFSLIKDVLTGKWGAAWDDIKRILGGAWDFIVGLIKQAVQIVSLTIGLAMAVVSQIWSAAWSAISAVLAAIWGGITSTISAGISAVVGFFAAMPGTIVGAIAALPGLIGGVFSGAISFVSGIVSSGLDGIVGFFAGLPGRAANGFADLGGALIGAFKSAWNAFADSITIPKIHIPGTDIDIGGGHPIPRIHTGGIVPGAPGQEVLAMLQAGEGVISMSQMRQLSHARQSQGAPAAAAASHSQPGQPLVVQVLLPDRRVLVQQTVEGVRAYK